MGRSRLQHSAVPPVFRRAKTAALVSAGNGAEPSRVTCISGYFLPLWFPRATRERTSAQRRSGDLSAGESPLCQCLPFGAGRAACAAAGQLRLLSPSRCFAIDWFLLYAFGQRSSRGGANNFKGLPPTQAPGRPPWRHCTADCAAPARYPCKLRSAAGSSG